MKIRIIQLVLLLCLGTLSSVFAQTLSAIPSNQDVGNTSSTTNFSVTSDISWTASSNASWLTVPTGGVGTSTLTATYTANPTVSQRVGTITLSGPEVSDVPLTVTQAAGAAVLTINETDQNVGNGSGSITSLPITSNISWTVSSNASWLTITSATTGSGNGTLTATFTANPTTSQRTGIITITGGGITRNVNIIQAAGAAVLTINETDQNVGNGSGSITSLPITSNISWTVSSNASWLTITSATTGSGNGTLTATFTANPTTSQRTGIITITGGGITRNVNIIQAAGAAVLTINETDQNVGNGSGSITSLPITSNISWTVSSNASWLTITSATTGSGNGTLTATFTANPTTSQRTGIITITGGGITRNVNIIQAAGAAVLTINETDQNVGNGSGSITSLPITSNISWTVSSNASWLTITSATTGSGNGTLTATFTANPTTSQRTGIITITGGGITRNVNIIQAAGAAVLTINETDQNVGNGSGSITSLPITSNISWTVSSNASWLTITSATTGSGNGTLTATFTANPTTSQRTGIITITGGGITRNVNIIQAAGAAVLTINETDQNVGNGSGSITSLPITSNISWTVSSNASWLTITSATTGSGNGTLTATFTANPTTSQRTGIITITGGGITRNVNIIQAAGAAVLTINETDQNVGNGSGSITSLPITSNISWTVSSNASWLTITSATTGSGNGTLTATFTANPTTSQRTGIITITGGGITRNVNIIQAAGAAVLTINETDQNVGNGSGSITSLPITSNISWTVSSNASWLTITSATTGSGNGTLTATFTANPTTSQRTGIITITGGGITRNVNIIQAAGAAVLTINETDQNVGNGSGSITSLPITSNISWTVSSNASWLTITSATTGSGNGTLTATFTANPTTSQRTGIITITGGGITRNVNIIQAQTNQLDITPTNQNVLNTSGNTTFTITSNVTWTATDDATWLTVTPSGTGSVTLTATYGANTSTAPRTGTITIIGGGITKTVTVTQAQTNQLDITPTNQNVLNTSGNTTFTITSNVTWTATDDATWLTVTPSGTGSVTLTATYGANTSTAPRTGTITIIGGGITKTVTVTQDQTNQLEVTPTNQNVLNTSGNTTFTITSNVTWTATDDATWLTVTPSGTGSGTLTATYGANTSTAPRTGTITIIGGGITKTVTVTQDQTNQLEVTPTNQNVLNTSGNTTFTITSNVGWTATDDATWLTVTSSGAGSVTLTATYGANTSTAPRTGTITIIGGGITKTVTVTQDQTNQLEVTPTNQNVLNTSGNTTFTITSNVTWTATDDATWLTVTPSGTGSGTLTAIFIANPTITQRVGNITITGGGITRNIIVTQDPRYIISATVSPSSGGNVTGTGNYLNGESVSLTATASTGYTFVNWTESGSVVSAAANYAFTATINRTLVANFSLNNYNLNVSILPLNSGTVTGNGVYPYGTTATLTATPATGYSFLNWSGSLNSTDNPENIVIDDNKNVTANFQLNSYVISTSSNPVRGGTSSGGATFNHGSQVTLVAISATGYRFVNWTLNGIQVSTDSTYIFTATSAGAYLANFKFRKFSVTTTPLPIEGGTIVGAGSYDYQSMVNIIATSNTGWRFNNWTEGTLIVSPDSNYSFILLQNRIFRGNFSKKIYNLTTNSLPVEAGVTTGDGPYEHGTNVTIVANPKTGWRFVNWTENSSVVFTDSSKSFSLLKSRSLTANYVKKVYSISSSSFPIIGGITKGDSSYTHGDEVTLTAIANADSGYEFVNWTEKGLSISTDSIYKFTAVSNRALVANFRLKTYSVSIEKSVNPPSTENPGNPTGNGSYIHGDFVTIIANPEAGWLFANWSEGTNILSSLESYTFRILNNTTITANYSHVRYSIGGTPQPIDAGFVSGTGTAYYNQTITLTAAPNVGWEFKHWKEGDNIVSFSPAYQFTVTKERNLIAVFSLINYSITCSAEPSVAGRTNGCGLSYYGQDMTVSAIANNGYKFINWTENASIVSTSQDYTFTVQRDRNLVANFDFSTDLERLDNSDIIPENYYLSNAYPNPFNPETNIQFGLPEPSETSIVIFDLNGRVVSYLLDKVSLPAGNYLKKFNAINFTSGIYFYRIFTHATGSEKSFVKVGKLVLVK